VLHDNFPHEPPSLESHLPLDSSIPHEQNTPGEMLAALSQELSASPNLNKLGVKN